MKFLNFIVIIALAILIIVAYGYQQESIQSPKPLKEGLFDRILTNIRNILSVFKESKQMGQERKQNMNYECVWKVCSRPIFKGKHKETKEKDPKLTELQEIAQLKSWLKEGRLRK